MPPATDVSLNKITARDVLANPNGRKACQRSKRLKPEQWLDYLAPKQAPQQNTDLKNPVSQQSLLPSGQDHQVAGLQPAKKHRPPGSLFQRPPGKLRNRPPRSGPKLLKAAGHQRRQLFKSQRRRHPNRSAASSKPEDWLSGEPVPESKPAA